MGTKMYAACNFVLMSSPKKEIQFVQEVNKRMGECNRLISFHFKKELKVVMGVNDINGYRLYINEECVLITDTKEEQPIWDKIDEYPIGTRWEVTDAKTDNVVQDFIPF